MNAQIVGGKCDFFLREKLQILENVVEKTGVRHLTIRETSRYIRCQIRTVKTLIE
jgi:hypothetical protein